MNREQVYSSTYKEHHFWELQRRETINSTLSFLVGIVTVLTGATYTMAKEISSPCSFLNSIFLLGLCITALLLLTSMYLIARAYMGYKHAHSPDTLEILNYRNGLIERNRTKGMDEGEAVSSADQEFYDYLDETYATDASYNKKLNGIKAEWIYYANRTVFSSLVSIAISGTAFIFR